VLLPRQNEKNVNEDLTDELRHGLVVHYVDEIDEAIKVALQPSPQQQRVPEAGRPDEARPLQFGVVR
jgi:hypothetical protein